MFQPGDRIIYGDMGVCEVREIAVPSFAAGDGAREYYTLEPLGRQGLIFVPVDSTVFMRPVISREDAEALISGIPALRATECDTAAAQALAEHYSDALHTHDCGDLIALVMSIYQKKRRRAEQNQKFGAIDETYFKRAKELLYGEFSAALGIPPEAVEDYIAKRVRGKPAAPDAAAPSGA